MVSQTDALDPGNYLERLSHEYDDWTFVVTNGKVKAWNQKGEIPLVADYSMKGLRRIESLISG